MYYQLLVALIMHIVIIAIMQIVIIVIAIVFIIAIIDLSLLSHSPNPGMPCIEFWLCNVIYKQLYSALGKKKAMEKRVITAMKKNLSILYNYESSQGLIVANNPMLLMKKMMMGCLS